MPALGVFASASGMFWDGFQWVPRADTGVEHQGHVLFSGGFK